MAKKKVKQVRVTLKKGLAGTQRRHRESVRGLGLKRTHHSVVLGDTPEVRGMINKVSYLVEVEEV
ncbi:MAG: 50S ribosomal protein L30 [Lysobacteraceae bacterium]|nr:MAG: 50S ribosomal protein L30 [Xanthomonadaceae bacterium]